MILLSDFSAWELLMRMENTVGFDAGIYDQFAQDYF
jgi:hypothetical protein